MMMHGRNNGKKLMTVRIVKHAFEIIHLLTGEVRNPLSIPFCMCEWVSELNVHRKYNMYHYRYLPSAMFVAQRLVWLSKQLKQIIQIAHMVVAGPAVYHCFLCTQSWLQELFVSSLERTKTPV